MPVWPLGGGGVEDWFFYGVNGVGITSGNSEDPLDLSLEDSAGTISESSGVITSNYGLWAMSAIVRVSFDSNPSSGFLRLYSMVWSSHEEVRLYVTPTMTTTTDPVSIHMAWQVPASALIIALHNQTDVDVSVQGGLFSGHRVS